MKEAAQAMNMSLRQTLLALVTRTTTTVSADIPDHGSEGVTIFLSIGARHSGEGARHSGEGARHSGEPSLTVVLEGHDDPEDDYQTLATYGPVTSGFHAFIYLADLPNRWRTRVVAANDDAVEYSVGSRTIEAAKL